MSKNYSLTNLVFGALCLSGAYSSSNAADNPSGAISAMMEEVVVQARRKDDAEALQSVPLAVSAFSEDQLDAMLYTDLGDITQMVPNATAQQNVTYVNYVNFNIRGMGPLGSALSDEPTVGVFVDGVYQGTSAGILMDNFDMESIEILRGPQGTLFGRNVTGGAALLRTTAPSDEYRAKVKVRAGNFGAWSVAGLVTGPLVEDVLLGKLAILHESRDDFIDAVNKGKALSPNTDDLGEKDQWNIRAALTWRPSDEVEITFRAESMRSEQDPMPTDSLPGRPLAVANLNAAYGALFSPDGIVGPSYDDWDKHGNDIGSEPAETELDSFSVTGTWELGNGSLRSITAWREFEQGDMEQDFDNSMVPLFEIWEHEITQEQLSQEFVYNTSLSDSLSMTAGLYYFDQEVTNNDFRISAGFFGGPGNRGAHITYAVDQQVLGLFASFDYAVNDKLNLTFAARYTDEEKDAEISNVGAFAASGGTVGCSADGAFAMLYTGVNPKDTIDFSTCIPSYDGDESWSNVTPKFGIQYLLSNDTQFYASYTKGFRSGGFSTRGQLGTDPLYDEEEVNAFEVGLKHDFENGARLNLAIFNNEYDDLQENIFLSVATGEQITRNAAEATIQGFELETWIPLGERFLLQASAGYTDAEYDDYTDGVTDFSGNTMRGVPELQYTIGLIYDQPIADDMNLTMQAFYNYLDERHYTTNNLGYIAPEHENVNASISVSSGNWRVTAFGKNLTNDTEGGPGTDVSFWVVTTPYMPRTYGLEVTYEM